MVVDELQAGGLEPMVSGLHHINFIVHSLADASPAFELLFGAPAGDVEYLPERGVKLVRYRLGSVWFVLVEPTDPAGAPGQYLKEHGEGFFLASFQVSNLESALDALAKKGIGTAAGPRRGLENWSVVDLDPRAFRGVNIQLVKETSE